MAALTDPMVLWQRTAGDEMSALFFKRLLAGVSMYKKIMVAISDDETSRNALKEALHIAAAYGAKICIVHAVTNPGDYDERSDAVHQDGSDLLEQARSIATETLTVETRLLEADGQYGLNGVSEVISNAVSGWGADLLVVGTKGRRGLERLVIGSVAGKLVNTVDTSILLIRLHSKTAA